MNLSAFRFKHQVRATVVDTAEAYADVLALRERAYRASGKSVPPVSFAEVHATGDAKVFGFYFAAELVASFQVRVPGPDARLESVDVPLGEYPRRLPAKLNSIEISKLCIAPEYRGTDLIKAMFEQVHRELVLANRASILICCEERLIDKYRAIGFRRTGYSFRKNATARGRFEILVSTQRRFGVYGLHVGPLRWNLFLAEINRQMLQRGEIRPSPAALAVWSLYASFGHLATLWENFEVARRSERRAG